MRVSVRPYVREGRAVYGYTQERKKVGWKTKTVYKVGGFEFVLPERSARTKDVVVMVDVQKLDNVWKQDQEMYVGPGGTGAIHHRYDRFKEFMETGEPIEMSEVSHHIFPDGELHVGFTNGRHRFAVLRDLGMRVIPMAVGKKQAEEFKSLFGAETKQEVGNMEKNLRKSEVDDWYVGTKNGAVAFIMYGNKIISPDDTLMGLNQEVNGIPRDQGEYAEALFNWLMDNSYEMKKLVWYLSDHSDEVVKDILTDERGLPKG